MNHMKGAAALSSPNRVMIVRWLKTPRVHFPPQIHADIDDVGVCGAFIAEKLGVTPATASVHLRVLVDAGLLISTRQGKWTYFKRNEAGLTAFGRAIAEL